MSFQSVEELTAELKSLKKRLYAFQFKGLELQERARSHLLSHCYDDSSADNLNEISVGSDVKFEAFGTVDTPLSNEYILEIIANNLSVQELRNCRLVCKLWSKEIKRCIAKRRSIVVSDELDCLEAHDVLKAKKNGNYVNISTLVVLEIPLESQVIQELLSNFANTISGLKLDDCYPTAQEIYSILKQLPSLETFSLKSTISPLRNRRQSAALLDQLTSFTPKLQLNKLKKFAWEDCKKINVLHKLPEMCPNLKFLKLYLLGDCKPIDFVGLEWKFLQTLMLTAEDEFKADHFESLSALNLKIQRLHLQNVKPDGQIRTAKLTEFLQAQGPSLIELFLFESISYTNFATNEKSSRIVSNYSPFPIEMPVLKFLRVDFRFINSLQFIDSLPSLRKLDSSCQSWLNWWTILFKKQLPKPQEKVQELSLGAIDADCLRKVSFIFPNITRLDISEERIGDWALRIIFQNMGKLVSLRITKTRLNVSCPSITDAGITGIPIEECKRIMEEEKHLSVEKADALRINPFVGDLLDLRILEIDSSSAETDPQLTDVSVLYGIAKLNHLVMVSLPECKVSDAAWTSISCCPNIASIQKAGGRRHFKSQNCYANCDKNFNVFSDIDE